MPFTETQINWIKRTSYSSRLTLHGCPRKLLLNKLLPRSFSTEISLDFGGLFAEENTEEAEATQLQEVRQNVTFAYGKAVGVGIQELLTHGDLDQAILKMFLEWDCPLWDDSQILKKKSFEYAVEAVRKFALLDTIEFQLTDWELLTYEGKPAVELGYMIHLPNGATDRGFIDAVLRNKFSGEICVFECKTTGSRFVRAANYCNSEQGLSYAVVLDKLFGKMSSYSVIYGIYLTLSERWEVMRFPKSPIQRLEWFRNVVSDVTQLAGYVEDEYFPARGESCSAWGRDCAYIDCCHQDLSDFYKSDEALMKEIQADERPERYSAVISLDELISAQFETFGEEDAQA